LDNDGFSEKILLENNQKGNGDVKIYNPQIVGQFNSETPLPQANPNAIFDDCNNDGIQEIYFSGLRNDSLFINQVDYSDLKNPKEYFIEKLLANADFAVNISQAADLNNDGFKEILLTINAGFSLQPRKVYALNLQNKQILKTPFSGSKINNQSVFDIDNDGFLDILSGTFASRNYNEPDIAYTDQYSWIMAFDHNLNFKFEPIKTSEQKTSSNIIPFEKNNQKLIFAILNYKDQLLPYTKYLIINSQGKIIHMDSLYHIKSETVERSVIPFITENEDLVLLAHDGTFYKINEEFQFIIFNKHSDLKECVIIKQIDLNDNGRKEYIFRVGDSNQYVFFDDQLKHPAFLNLPSIVPLSENISLNKTDKGKTELVIQKKEEIFHLSYKKNPWWNFRFFIWGLITGSIYALIWLIQYIQKERIKTQIRSQQQIRELQFKAITSQLNPHFMFNALTAISKSVYNPENPEVYNRFITFSRLIRQVLSDSDKITRTLEKEIDFTTDFMEIQKYRFKNAFDFQFEIDKNVNTLLPVPKLAIQIFVENAIKHAFPANNGNDIVKITIQNIKQIITISIEDNGIGRAAAQILNTKTKRLSTGIGLKVMQDYIDLLNTQNINKITFDFEDLSNGVRPTGTKVTVRIPENYNYKVN
jgi:hypothetical protein